MNEGLSAVLAGAFGVLVLKTYAKGALQARDGVENGVVYFDLSSSACQLCGFWRMPLGAEDTDFGRGLGLRWVFWCPLRSRQADLVARRC